MFIWILKNTMLQVLWSRTGITEMPHACIPMPAASAKNNLVSYTKHQDPAYHIKLLVRRTGTQKYHVSFHFNFRQTMHHKRQYLTQAGQGKPWMYSSCVSTGPLAEVAGTQGSTRYDCRL
jgi:hypothetical protein